MISQMNKPNWCHHSKSQHPGSWNVNTTLSIFIKLERTQHDYLLWHDKVQMVRLDHNTSKKNNSKAFRKSTRITTELFSYLHKLLLLFVLQEYYKCCLSSLLHTFMSFIMGYKNRTFTTRQGFEQSISLSFPFPSNGKKITAG